MFCLSSVLVLTVLEVGLCTGQLVGDVQVEYVSKDSYHLGEGPFWDERQSVLYHVDTFVGDVCRLNVTDGRTQRLHLRDYVSIIIPIEGQSNRFVVSRRNEIIVLDWKAETYRVLTDVGPEKFNDGKVDANGRLWIGTLRNSDPNTNNGAVRFGGGLYRQDGKRLTKVDTCSLPNGMAWSLDNKKFYIADTNEKLINQYDFDLKTGTLSNKRVLLNFNKHPDFKPWELPDGMAIDKDGKLWIAIIFGARIICLNPNDGKIERWIPTPDNQTTSIAFGGTDFRDMYVTTGWRLLSDDERKKKPNIGKVLKITSDFIRGPGPAYRVKLDTY